MAETVGLLILSATGAGSAVGIAGLGTVAGTTIAGVGIATIVGTTAIVAASIGLNYALANTDVPRPESGSQALKQAIPSRIRGYWVNRLAGSYVYFSASLTPPNVSYDVIAFHHGLVTEILQIFLSDDVVSIMSGDLSSGATVQGDGTYYSGGRTIVQVAMGTFPQSALLQGYPETEWTSDFRGDGIAAAALVCGTFVEPSEHSRVYPRGKPELSLVAVCSPVWDPRDGAQDPDNEATWVPSPNPVLQLMDFLTRPGSEGGMGHDRAILFPPARLAQWMVEANLCSGRYSSAGWYKFDNKPEDVVNKMLATCDGYMVEDGEGTFELTVGVYREPTEPPITDTHIFGWTINHGVADEQLVNQLDVSFTDPAQKYTSRQIDSVRDEASISLAGIARPQPLDLSWVQDEGQAALLGQRALLRLNPAKTGSIVTSLYGFRWIGKRWVRMQFSAVDGLQDCVIEIQSASINILAGRITFNFNTVDTVALAAL
ncbi:phage tail protein [Bradyrhizobium sp. 18]|uniref:phage tail protein n=1 Tax=Bradyrhizobium sp. 18 TaxID=2782657 RepID=UPI001FFA6DA9|nr:phage tail protein [Bradyrhizobium sp. 18]MCK1503854.1 hypothetical protein [Bradyrhizobium sp. 18]